MTRYVRHMKTLLLLALVGVSLTACYDVEGEREICDYKALLRYDYNEENTSGGVNMIEWYVYTIDEYIFREDGILFQHRRFTPDHCTEHMDSELNLPPGRYSVIAIGNQDERSFVSDGDCSATIPQKGVTHRDLLLMRLRDAEVMPGGTSGMSERLYYGYKTFTVKEQGISRVRVDMINAHMRLKFRVTWKGTTPSKTDNYYALIESVPSEYRLMPEYIYPKGVTEIKKHDPDIYDEYPSNCNSVIHHIPHTCYKPAADPQAHNILTHRYDTYINGDGVMWGYFTTYRIKQDTKPMLKIYRQGVAPLADVLITKVIPLQEYFDWWGYESPTSTLKQDYELNIVVNLDGSADITPLEIADWEEGGEI